MRECDYSVMPKTIADNCSAKQIYNIVKDACLDNEMSIKNKDEKKIRR